MKNIIKKNPELFLFLFLFSLGFLVKLARPISTLFVEPTIYIATVVEVADCDWEGVTCSLAIEYNHNIHYINVDRRLVNLVEGSTVSKTCDIFGCDEWRGQLL